MAQSADTRYLAHLSWPQIDALDKEDGVVLLPIGAVEQHGPHMPTLTDSLIATHMVDETLKALPPEVKAWALPPLNYGKSNEHINFPGTITLTTPTLRAVVHDIADSVARSGFRRLAFVNGHGGNVPVLQAATRDIRVDTGLMTFYLQSGIVGEADRPFELSAEEARFGFHAGETETSMVLAIDSSLVEMDKAIKHIANFPETDTPLFLFGGASAAWLADDWGQEGVFGDATIATEEKGHALIEAGVKQLAKIITAISTFEVSRGVA